MMPDGLTNSASAGAGDAPALDVFALGDSVLEYKRVALLPGSVQDSNRSGGDSRYRWNCCPKRSASVWKRKALQARSPSTSPARPPADDPPRHVREREASRALALLRERATDLEEFAAVRARTLLNDHRRAREAGQAVGNTSVQTLPRPDVIGAYVALPRAG